MELRRKPLLLGVLISLGGSFFITFLFYPRALLDQPFEFLVGAGINWVLYFMLWFGNRSIYKQIDQRLSWFSNLNRRLLTGVGIMSLISFVVIFIYNYGSYQIAKYYEITANEEAIEVLYYKSIFDFFYALLVIGGLHSISFFEEWKRSEIKTERLQKQNLESHLATLKNQLSPHFLFNSLNVLSTLIHQDPKLAEKFINRLSLVYRYLLDNKDKEVINLDTELDFIKSYVFLLKIRFGENLNITINVNDQVDAMVPPMAVQMLLENAIKHNIIAEKKPLDIQVLVTDDNYLAVSNNLQIRSDKSRSTNVGLGNIRRRYEFLTNKEVEITQTQDEFIVKIPLLKFTKQ